MERIPYIFLKNNLNLKNISDKTKSLAIGACCFRRKPFGNNKYYWSLDWIWLHPYFRHQHILSGYWETFMDTYQGFYVEPPYSLEMQSFLAKINWDEDINKYLKEEIPIQ